MDALARSGRLASAIPSVTSATPAAASRYGRTTPTGPGSAGSLHVPRRRPPPSRTVTPAIVRRPSRLRRADRPFRPGGGGPKTSAMREYVDGNAAIVRGALAAGCSFFAGYPITPASGILMAMMRELPVRGGVAIQGEDEIASIGMCIGAAMAGSRAMTATSGPGMSLMSENLGLAIMGEVPLVVVDVQRLGPATGGATTVGQGDVQFARWGTPGGYSPIVLAPTDAVDAYALTVRAFELADRFRCPVLLLTDKEVATTLATVDAAAFAPVAVAEREVATVGAPYRYVPAADVPPLRRYGAGDAFRFTGSTHDERALITKDPSTVDALNRHLA